MATLGNALLFNVSWLLIVLSQNSLLAPVLVVVHLAVHNHFADVGRQEWKLIALVSVVGLLVDQLLFRTGLLVNPTGSLWAPLWLSCLWPVFASTLMHCFRWLHGRWVLAALFGAVGGAASYRAGVALSELTLSQPLLGLGGIALAWLLLFPAAIYLAAIFWDKQQEMTNAA